jgi:endonuclease/exonuclease/phosphatase family metal-dependent hydrolase
MSNHLRIITYNIHRSIGVDRKTSPERIADVIAAQEPDVVALQEVDFGQARPTLYDQASIIAEKLDFQPVWIERERCGNAILSRFPMKMVKAGGLRRPRRWHSIARRGALWVEVEAHGARIQVINTHLGLTPASRLNQVKVLLGPEWLNNPDCRPPVILCGDFNTQSGSAVFRLINGRLRNVGELMVDGQSERTWPSSHPLICIDHMFISEDVEVKTVTVPTGGKVRIASDHLPLLVQINLSDPP